jgi:hypothetical protein
MKHQYSISRIFFVVFFANLSAGYLCAQPLADSTLIKKLLDKADARQKAYTPEKLYLHFDKPYYAAGDTAWFKAYVLQAGDLKASTYSAKIYVELLNGGGQLVQRLVVPVASGLAQGYFALDEKKVPEGSYTIRAYTNWLQNFGSEHFFYKQFYIGKLGGKTWLLTEQHLRNINTDTGSITLAMRFNDSKGLPIMARAVNIKVLDGAKVILKSGMTTGADGTLTGTFTLPPKVNKRALSIAVDDVNDKTQHISFPFYPSGSGSDIDLQFMPEGGSLVAGVYNRVGFKAIGEDGLSRDVKGIITDSKGQEAASLQSVHNGMGSFVLVPRPGETYRAKIFANGKEKYYALPAASGQGMSLRVNTTSNADELYVYITANAAGDKQYTLVAQSASRVYFGSEFTLNGEGFFNTRIAKGLFPTGILDIMILGPDQKPLNHRSVFINHHDGLKVTTSPGKTTYAPKDSISINLKATNSNNGPVQANFSISVTDDTQIKDALQPDNLQSHMLLTSEIKGNIENPAWYFENGDEKLKEKALDNLLLTQAWQGFDWSEIEKPVPAPAWQPEPDISVSGKLKNFFGKPATGLKIELLATGKHPFFQDTVSDKDGRFAFCNLPFIDTVAYLLKLHNKREKTATAEIVVDEFKPTESPLTGLPRPLPWNLNADTTLINYINKASQRSSQPADDFVPAKGDKLLKQVDINAQRQIKYEGGEFAVELMTIDEKELMAAKKMSLMDLLHKKFPGFGESYLYARNVFEGAGMHTDIQFVNGSMLINDIVADGTSVANPNWPIEDVTVSPNGVNAAVSLKPDRRSKLPTPNLSKGPSAADVYDNLKLFLNSLGADDVKSIRLYRGTQMFLVIETRSHHGPYAVPSLGAMAYRPPVMQFPKQFYSPKYDVKNRGGQPDLRSTLYWEPNLVTDEKGNAKLSFYAADKPGTYTVVIEGTDMQGHFEVSTQKITIGPGMADQ